MKFAGLNYLYSKHDTEAVNYLEASPRLMKGKKKTYILFTILSSVLYSLMIGLPVGLFVGVFMGTEVTLFLGLAALVLVVGLPLLHVGINVSLYKLLDN